jgi:tRNA-specific 2-thiouridylase
LVKAVKMRVAVGLSGGVDSSAAAAILRTKGHEVIGISMKIWDGSPMPLKSYHACYGPDEEEDIEDARQVSRHLGIPFYVLDLTQEYKKIILEYFKVEYASGRTPNPCVRCNQRIKFEKLLEKAQISGIPFDYFATGHYASVAYCPEKKRYLLRKAKDVQKDQSYWLAFLSQKQLGKVLFPLAEYTKEEVRKLAREFALNIHAKPDSQDFIAGDYTHLLDMPQKPGPIVDKEGRQLGTHKGIFCYTIGQRKGLGISAKRPLYVKEIDVQKNTVIVGPREELSNAEFIGTHFNGIAIDELTKSIQVSTKIRNTHKEAEGMLSPIENGKVQVKFKKAQSAITPGQTAVFYDEDIVVGAALIEKAGGV